MNEQEELNGKKIMDYRYRCPVVSIINFLVSDTSSYRFRQSAAFCAKKTFISHSLLQIENEKKREKGRVRGRK